MGLLIGFKGFKNFILEFLLLPLLLACVFLLGLLLRVLGENFNRKRALLFEFFLTGALCPLLAGFWFWFWMRWFGIEGL